MSTAKSKGFTGFHMWMLALCFFGVIIAVNVTMATFAMRSWTGLVVDNSYVASQEFEEKRLAHEAQRAAGWDAVLTYRPGAARLVIVDGARPNRRAMLRHETPAATLRSMISRSTGVSARAARCAGIGEMPPRRRISPQTPLDDTWNVAAIDLSGSSFRHRLHNSSFCGADSRRRRCAIGILR